MHAGGVAEHPYYDSKDPLEELVVVDAKPRDWKGIFISLLVISSVISLVYLTILLVTPPPGPPRVFGRRLEYRQVSDSSFTPNSFNATWLSGSLLALLTGEGALAVFNTTTNQAYILTDNSTFRAVRSSGFLLSPSLNYLLLSYDQVHLHRYSREASYKYTQLSQKVPSLTSLLGGALLQAVVWAGQEGLLMVASNNIYYQPSLSSNSTFPVTLTGRKDVFHGVPDWLYEEELLYSSAALWVSPDSSLLAFATFNDTAVGKHVVTSVTGAWRPVVLNYPLPGGNNPEVTVTVTELLGEEGLGRSWGVQPPPELANSSLYLGGVSWASDSTLCVTWMPRTQTSLYYTLCPAPHFNCRIVGGEEGGGRGWVDLRGQPLFSQDSGRMAAIVSTDQGSKGYYPNLVLFRVSQSSGAGSLPMELTRGQQEVTKLHCWDHDKGRIYYTATGENSPGTRHLYWVADTGRETPSCVTCSTPCMYNKVHMSPSCRAYVQECLGPGVPYSVLHSLTDNTSPPASSPPSSSAPSSPPFPSSPSFPPSPPSSPSPSPLLWLDTNSHISELLNITAIPQNRFLSLPLPERPEGAHAKLQVLLPPGYRDGDKIAFPTVFQIYGGPGSQLVSQQWRVDWGSYLASSRGYVVISLDVRGSGLQGDSHRKAVYRRLGQLEVEDILHVIREASLLPFVDSSRLALWGWSYGGFLAVHTLARDQGVKGGMLGCGIAVAPVSKWQLYDSTYSERFLGSPESGDNWQGYQKADITNTIGQLQDNKLLLVHGTADDNVHLAHSMHISRALIERGVMFKQMIYPEEKHGLTGVLPHLHSTMEEFLVSCLGSSLLSPPDTPYTQSDIP